MITSQLAKLPSKIKVYYGTWTRLGLNAHELLSANLIRAIVCTTPFWAGYARIVSIAKAKVGFVESMLAVAVIKAVRRALPGRTRFRPDSCMFIPTRIGRSSPVTDR